MKPVVLGYSDFLKVFQQKSDLKLGFMVDTNILISATYDSDHFFESTTEFFDFLAEYKVPIFCNVNVRNEFLEIQRRIIFTEALIDFYNDIDRSILPIKILAQLGKWSANNKKRIEDNRSPLRLSESDIKSIKLELIKIEDAENDKNLWLYFCEVKIGNKLEALWNKLEDELGLNFLSSQNPTGESLFHDIPQWSETVKLIEKYGLSSSDAMILNLYKCSNLLALVSSDQEIVDTVMRGQFTNKICFVPDSLRLRLVQN